MVPSSSIALFLSIIGHLALPLTISARNAAFTSAAGSTPGETRFWIRSRRNSSLPFGGLARSLTSSWVCSASSGFAGTPSALRSSTWDRYASITCASFGRKYGEEKGGGGLSTLARACQPHHAPERAFAS